MDKGVLARENMFIHECHARNGVQLPIVHNKLFVALSLYQLCFLYSSRIKAYSIPTDKLRERD